MSSPPARYGAPAVTGHPEQLHQLARVLDQSADAVAQSAAQLRNALDWYSATCGAYVSAPAVDCDELLRHAHASADAGMQVRSFATALKQADDEHPFFQAAIDTGPVPLNRVALLLRLDQLATMPLDEFLAVRETADTEAASLDWRTDGCSGPIPKEVADACLRHDFLYRNARMLRDLLGLSPEFARQIKRYADRRFGDELRAGYDKATLVLNPELALWIFAAEQAVKVFGSVEKEWRRD